MKLEDFVQELRTAFAADLVGVILYGSAAGADYHGPASGHNVLVLVRRASVGGLREAARVVRKWMDGKNPPPLVLTVEEWRGCADVFAMEYADLLERHRVLFGELPTAGVSVRGRDLRMQLESEAMGKLLRFRRGVMSAGSDARRVHALLEESLSSVLAIFRATAHLHGEAVPESSEALCDRVGALIGAKTDSVRAVVAHRRAGEKLEDDALDGVVAGYLDVLERLASHADQFSVTD